MPLWFMIVSGVVLIIIIITIIVIIILYIYVHMFIHVIYKYVRISNYRELWFTTPKRIVV